VQSFRGLRVWEKAHKLTLDVYTSSKAFPREEMYGLTSQMRRASASIGMNIAEGCCRKGNVEMARFLQIAMGSGRQANLSTNFYSPMTSIISELQSMNT
jgi:four helix bundle protein